jgi:uncharacterized protein (TIGR00255 family)
LPQVESLVRQAIREKVRRGRVEVAVHLQSSSAHVARINRGAIAAYCELARTVRNDFQLEGELTLAALLQLPGVLESPAPLSGADRTAFEDRVRISLQTALDAVQQMRLQEGRQLQADLLERLGHGRSLLDAIAGFTEPAKQAYRERLIQKLQEYRDLAQWDSERMTQELVVFAERGDITEEITRLRSHCDQFAGLVEEGGEAGKKLDFLLQEMNREANTILSKSLHRKISELGVLLKAEIEKLREQVQNIE